LKKKIKKEKNSGSTFISTHRKNKNNLHGPPNIKNIVAKPYYPDSFLAYVKINSKETALEVSLMTGQ
jgi:hypothetical protein